MEHYAGIDVSLELSSVCVVDGQGKIAKEGKVASEPEALINFFGSLDFAVKRIGLEAGPLSQRRKWAEHKAYCPKSRRRDGGSGEAVTRPVAVIRRTTRI
jgi:hypothetical protein